MTIDSATGNVLPDRSIVFGDDRLSDLVTAAELPDGRMFIADIGGFCIVDLPKPLDHDWQEYLDRCFLSQSAVDEIAAGTRDRDATYAELALSGRGYATPSGSAISLGEPVVNGRLLRAPYNRWGPGERSDNLPDTVAEYIGVVTLDLKTMTMIAEPLPATTEFFNPSVLPKLSADGQTAIYVNGASETIARDLETGEETQLRAVSAAPTSDLGYPLSFYFPLPFYGSDHTIDLDRGIVDSVTTPSSSQLETVKWSTNGTAAPSQGLIASSFSEKPSHWFSLPLREPHSQWLHLTFVSSDPADGSSTVSLSSDAIRVGRRLAPATVFAEEPKVAFSPDGRFLLFIEGRSDDLSDDPTPVHLIDVDELEAVRPE